MGRGNQNRALGCESPPLQGLQPWSGGAVPRLMEHGGHALPGFLGGAGFASAFALNTDWGEAR